MTKYVDTASQPLVNNAKNAFLDVTNDLFKNQIDPTLLKIQSYIDSDIDKINEDIKILLDTFEQKMNGIIDVAAGKAKELVDSTVDKIKKEIIGSISVALNDLIENINDKINDIIDRIVDILHDVDCTIERKLDDLKGILRGVNILSVPIYKEEDLEDDCRKVYKYNDLEFDFMTPKQQYNLITCRLMKNMSEKIIFDIWLSFGHMQYVSQIFACLYNKSPILVKFFTLEYMKYTTCATRLESIMNINTAKSSTLMFQKDSNCMFSVQEYDVCTDCSRKTKPFVFTLLDKYAIPIYILVILIGLIIVTNFINIIIKCKKNHRDYQALVNLT